MEERIQKLELDVLICNLFQDYDTLENARTKLRAVRDDFFKNAYKDSLSTVNTLIGQGIRVGILSATNKRNLTEDLIRLEFPIDSLVVLQGSDETQVHKPDPDVFLPLIEKLRENSIGREDILYVGDSLDDLKAATAAGIGFIAITTGLYSEEDFRKNGAQIILKDLTELIEKII